jgi:hypothetical protein
MFICLFLMVIHYANFVLWTVFITITQSANVTDSCLPVMTCDEMKLISSPWNVFFLFLCRLKSIPCRTDMTDGSQYHK